MRLVKLEPLSTNIYNMYTSAVDTMGPRHGKGRGTKERWKRGWANLEMVGPIFVLQEVRPYECYVVKKGCMVSVELVTV